MKIKIILILTLTSLLSFNQVKASNSETLSPEQTNQIIEILLRDINAGNERQCTNTEVLSCLNMNKKQCMTIQNEITNDCLVKIIKAQKGKEITNDLASELKRQHKLCSLKVAQKYNVDVQRYLSCSPDSIYQYAK